MADTGRGWAFFLVVVGALLGAGGKTLGDWYLTPGQTLVQVTSTVSSVVTPTGGGQSPVNLSCTSDDGKPIASLYFHVYTFRYAGGPQADAHAVIDVAPGEQLYGKSIAASTSNAYPISCATLASSVECDLKNIRADAGAYTLTIASDKPSASDAHIPTTGVQAVAVVPHQEESMGGLLDVMEHIAMATIVGAIMSLTLTVRSRSRYSP